MLFCERPLRLAKSASRERPRASDNTVSRDAQTTSVRLIESKRDKRCVVGPSRQRTTNKDRNDRCLARRHTCLCTAVSCDRANHCRPIASEQTLSNWARRGASDGDEMMDPFRTRTNDTLEQTQTHAQTNQTRKLSCLHLIFARFDQLLRNQLPQLFKCVCVARHLHTKFCFDEQERLSHAKSKCV